MKKIKIAISIFVFMLMFLPLASYGMAQQKGVPSLETIPAVPGAISENGIIQDQVQTKTLKANKELKAVQMRQSDVDGQVLESATGVKKQMKAKAGANNGSRSETRKSQVANAVHEMLRVADRSGGIGQQIKLVAQNQENNHEQMENQLDVVKNRGKLKKFFFGPDYKNLNSVEEKLANHDTKLNELKSLALELTNEDDIALLEDQINIMEQVRTELTEEVLTEKKGFSLFGWLNKMFTK